MQDWKNCIPITRDNVIEDKKKWRNKKYYNYQKKSHFTKNLPLFSKKISLGLSNFYTSN